jgi:GNAT superfamily N-acetyltransferase
MPEVVSWKRDGYTISTDPVKIDLAVVHRYLSEESYWAKGIPLETVARTVQGSLCFTVLHGESQVGFARVISDHAVFAFLADVFILDPHRGNGLSKWLIECIKSHPDLQGLRRWLLVTADAHQLYGKYGFVPLSAPERWMEIHDPLIYQRNAPD